MGDVEPQDTADELMSLYKALRATPDQHLRQAIKNRIDLLVEQAHREFQPHMIGAEHPGRKADA